MLLHRRWRILWAIVLGMGMECMLSSTLMAQTFPKLDNFGDPLPEGAILRLGSTRLQHMRGAWGVAFSPDGKVLATGSTEGYLNFWNVADGRSIRTLRYPKAAVQELSFSADGRRLAFAAYPREAVVIDVATGKQLQRLEVDLRWEGWIRSLAISPDGQTLATLSLSSTGDGMEWVAETWDCTTGRHLYEYRFPGSDGIVQTLAFSPDGERLAAGGSAHPAILNWRTQKVIVQPGRLKDERIVSLAFAADGKSVVTGGYNHLDNRGRIRVCDTANGASIRLLIESEQAQLPACSALALSRDGKVLATSHANRLLIWDFPTGRILREIKLPGRSYQNNGLAVSADGTLVIMDTHMGVQVWKTRDGSFLHNPLEGHRGRIDAIQWSSDGESLISLSTGESVRVWNTLTGRQTALVERGEFLGNQLLLTPDSKTLMCSEQEGFRFYELSTQRILNAVATGHPTASAISPDGRILAIGTKSRLSLWDISTRKAVAHPVAHDDSIVGLSFSGDGKMLVSVTANGVLRRWDTTQWKLLEPARDEFPARNLRRLAPLQSVTFSGDLSTVGILSKENLLSLHKATGLLARTIIKNDRFQEAEIVFSPDGRIVAVTHDDFAEEMIGIQLIDTSTGRMLHKFKGEHGGYASVKFSRDGKRLAAGSRMGTILIYDLPEKLLKR